MRRNVSLFFVTIILACAVATGCNSQKEEVPQEYGEVLETIPAEELSYLGAHFCLKRGGSWKCEQTKQQRGNYPHYGLSPGEDFSVLLVVHDERPVSEYLLYKVSLAGHGYYPHPYLAFSAKEAINANPLPIDYKGKKIYVLEPDDSQIDKTPEAFAYHFALSSASASNEVLVPGFDFKK